ncbi:hypothetical protein STEG23_006476 [Scotinomys teguina]
MTTPSLYAAIPNFLQSYAYWYNHGINILRYAPGLVPSLGSATMRCPSEDQEQSSPDTGPASTFVLDW